MQVRLLGPVDVVVEGGPRPVHGLRRMAVLATLALHCGVLADVELTDDLTADGTHVVAGRDGREPLRQVGVAERPQCLCMSGWNQCRSVTDRRWQRARVAGRCADMGR